MDKSSQLYSVDGPRRHSVHFSGGPSGIAPIPPATAYSSDLDNIYCIAFSPPISFLLPHGVASQLNDLHKNPCLRLCFQETSS